MVTCLLYDLRTCVCQHPYCKFCGFANESVKLAVLCLYEINVWCVIAEARHE